MSKRGISYASPPNYADLSGFVNVIGGNLLSDTGFIDNLESEIFSGSYTGTVYFGTGIVSNLTSNEALIHNLTGGTRKF